jgi:hypothetical protein
MPVAPRFFYILTLDMRVEGGEKSPVNAETTSPLAKMLSREAL